MSDEHKPTQITLELNLGESAVTIEKIFERLTDEDLLRIARESVTAWVNEPFEGERREMERELVVKMLGEKIGYGDRKRYKDEAEVRESRDFENRRKQLKPTRAAMFEAILAAVLRAAREGVEAIVGDSEQMQTFIDEAVEAVAAEIPHMVQAAITAHFVEALRVGAAGIVLEQRIASLEELTTKIQQHTGVW